MHSRNHLAPWEWPFPFGTQSARPLLSERWACSRTLHTAHAYRFKILTFLTVTESSQKPWLHEAARRCVGGCGISHLGSSPKNVFLQIGQPKLTPAQSLWWIFLTIAIASILTTISTCPNGQLHISVKTASPTILTTLFPKVFLLIWNTSMTHILVCNYNANINIGP
jgi:hypothetical protein